METYRTVVKSSQGEIDKRQQFFDLFARCPIEGQEKLWNLGLFISRQSLARMLFMYELYQKCVGVHGVVMEFGVRWGQNLALFSNFRGMLEPFNYNRKIIGFDTFAGFPSVSEKDLTKSQVGDYAVPPGYEDYLKQLLSYHESESPIPHIKKFELVKGDATVTLKEYLAKHPETIISLAYFDFDIYKPTLECLRMIKPHLTKGSVLGFDELNYDEFPGETIALREVFGTNQLKIRRSPLSPLQSYAIYGE
jgi:hypothetical protein